MAVLGDFLRRIARIIDQDLLRGDENSHGCFKPLDVEAPILALEFHQVERCQVTGGVIEEEILRAWIRGILPCGSLAGVPPVYGTVELHSWITTNVRSFGYLAQQ